MARIIFVPGKNPKPPPTDHRRALWRCLVNGVRRVNHDLADSLESSADSFRLVSWNHDFYGEDTRIEDDRPWIEHLLQKHGPTAEDIEDANSWNKRLTAFSYSLADRFPWLINLVADEAARSTIRETHRYFANLDGAAERIHEKLLAELQPALASGEPVLLIGHSLGSVIAWNVLWLLTHREGCRENVDHLLTLGSPLGMRFVQRRLLGNDHEHLGRYPACINHWTNIAAVGDLTALDEYVHDDFAEMLSLKLVDDINEKHGRIYNFYRDDDGLNPHRSYGYLANPVVGQVIASWWYHHGKPRG
ncbi:MAG: hypothetical protein R3270_05645 [Gammaproteobacteria bacterium]|nr:hypothetical protein [Gammaproteobacteria bacterium]